MKKPFNILKQRAPAVRTLLSLCLLLSLGSGLGLSLNACSQAASEEGQTTPLASPRQGTFSQQVQLIGEIEAIKQVYLAPAFSAKLEKLAEDGSQVKAKALVARLETTELEERLDEEKLELETARSALVEHQRSTAGEKVRLDAEIQRAQALLEQKELALRQLQAGTRPEELEKTRLQLDLARKALELSRSNLALKEKLAAKGMSTQLEVLQARLALSNQERDFKVAEVTHQQALRGATPLTRQLAQQEVSNARKALSWARQLKTLTLKKADLERLRKQASADNEAAGVKELELQIKQASISAPMAGTVVISKSWTQEGLKRVSVGDQVFEGNAFVSVADLSLVKIRTEVDETLIRDLKPGMSCSFALPSLKGRRFAGKISRIGVLAHTRSGRLNTEGLSKVFDLEITPEKVTDVVFQPGTSVDIQLPFQQKRDVLLLPRSAVQRRGDQHFVTLADGSEREVKLGDANAQDVVILSGLSAAEQVQLPLSAAEDSTAEDSETASNPETPEADSSAVPAEGAGQEPSAEKSAPPGSAASSPAAGSPAASASASSTTGTAGTVGKATSASPQNPQADSSQARPQRRRRRQAE